MSVVKLRLSVFREANVRDDRISRLTVAAAARPEGDA
jgi:hypothetical protein